MGLLGESSLPLAIWVAERILCEEDAILHECSPRFCISVFAKYLTNYTIHQAHHSESERPYFLSQHSFGWPCLRPRSYVLLTKNTSCGLTDGGMQMIFELFRKPQISAADLFCAPQDRTCCLHMPAASLTPRIARRQSKKNAKKLRTRSTSPPIPDLLICCPARHLVQPVFVFDSWFECLSARHQASMAAAIQIFEKGEEDFQQGKTLQPAGSIHASQLLLRQWTCSFERSATWQLCGELEPEPVEETDLQSIPADALEGRVDVATFARR